MKIKIKNKSEIKITDDSYIPDKKDKCKVPILKEKNNIKGISITLDSNKEIKL